MKPQRVHQDTIVKLEKYKNKPLVLEMGLCVIIKNFTFDIKDVKKYRFFGENVTRYYLISFEAQVYSSTDNDWYLMDDPSKIKYFLLFSPFDRYYKNYIKIKQMMTSIDAMSIVNLNKKK